MPLRIEPSGKRNYVYFFSSLLLLFTLCDIHLLDRRIARMTGFDLSGSDLPRVVEHPNKKTLREEPFLQQSVKNSSTTLDCRCPRTCGPAALSYKAHELTYTCQDRINYLMTRYHNTQEDACFAAANEAIQACGSECNPDVCDTQSNTSIVRLPEGHTGRLKVLVIAAVPKDENHAVSLWTELECLTGGIDLVVLSVPNWSQNLTEHIASRARKELGLNVDTRYYVNDRYDLGLWCDALQDIRGTFKVSRGSVEYESIILLNDSVFAMRTFTGIQDRLAQSSGKLDMVGLSYSTTGTDGRPWLER